MRKFALLTAVALICIPALARAQDNPVFFWDLPKFTQSPTLDGDRNTVPGEWAGAFYELCSPSQVEADALEYGWINQEVLEGVISYNQLQQNGELEDAAIAKTDADCSAEIWTAWDDEGLYYVTEVRDNIRDTITESESQFAWWERDGMTLYLDLNNEDNPGGDPTGFFVSLNAINFMAAPVESSAITIQIMMTVANQLENNQDPEVIGGFTYGFQDVGDKWGSDESYTIEGIMPWTTFHTIGNLLATPTVGSEMGYGYLLLDADGETGYGGQIQCAYVGAFQSDYPNWVFTDTPVGPDGTAVQEDSWGRIKATFAN
jgi:hypothetical protein